MRDPRSIDSYESEKDLRELLIDDEEREGVHFEFKGQYTGDVKNKLGKHVSAFANSHGGLLAIGVEADDLAAVDAPGIAVPDTGFEDSVSQKIASTINTVPLFRTKLVPVGENGNVVLLIGVEESAYPPHLFDGMIYIRPAQQSDPVRPENTAEIDRLYQKRQLTQARIWEAFNQTWFRTQRTPCSVYLIACPIVIKEDLLPVFDSASLHIFREIAGLLPPGGCDTVMVAANEFRCRDTDGTYTARITPYGLVEALVEVAAAKGNSFFSPSIMADDLDIFLIAVSKLYQLCGYSGPFRLILGVKALGRRTDFSTGGSPQISESCEKDEFTVERTVSLFGDQSIVDFGSRKRILEGMSREYLANFGTRIDLIEGMYFAQLKDWQ